nr:unnamed protein product [Digitaria exilis]
MARTKSSAIWSSPARANPDTTAFHAPAPHLDDQRQRALREAVARVAREQRVPGDEVVAARHFVEHPTGAGDKPALGVHVEERRGGDGIGGEGGEPGEDERVDEAAGEGVPEACAGAERRGDGRGVRVQRAAVAGLEVGEEEVEDAAVMALPGSTRQLLHP